MTIVKKKIRGITENTLITYLSIITGSDGVSLRFPQLFLSQQRLKQKSKNENINIRFLIVFHL